MRLFARKIVLSYEGSVTMVSSGLIFSSPLRPPLAFLVRRFAAATSASLIMRCARDRVISSLRPLK